MLLNLTKHQEPNIDKIYLYNEDPFKRKKRMGLKLKNPKASIDYSQTIHENLEDYVIQQRKQVLIEILKLMKN